MRTEELKIINIDDLIPYVNNARTHSKEQITKIRSSLREFGFVNPILIDKNKNIIAGHGRLVAAKEEGIKEVPCVLVEHLTEVQKKAYILADNRLALAADWDNELLALELENLKDLDFNISLIGFDDEELEELFLEESNLEVIEDDYDEAPPEEPISKYGDIWVLGRHRIMCGDSTKEEDVKVLMNNDLADMILTDPPYNVNYEGGTGLKIKNDSMDNDNFRMFLRDAFKSGDSALKPGGVFYIWHADSEGYNFRGACFDVAWKVRQCLIWVKNALVMGRQDYHWQHEPCLYGWKEGAGHLWATDRKQTTILNFDKPKVNDVHPTMKPIALFDYQIKNNTKGQDVVLDLFLGSGTTVIACEQNERRAYGLELDEKYADVIINRYIAFKESSDDVYLLRDGERIKYSDITDEGCA